MFGRLYTLPAAAVVVRMVRLKARVLLEVVAVGAAARVVPLVALLEAGAGETVPL